MKKVFLVLGLAICATNAWCQDDLIAYTVEQSNIQDYLPQVSEESNVARFSDNELVLNSDAKISIYNAKGSVIYYNDSTKIIDCSGWQKGEYTAKINDTTVFKFTR